MNNICDNKIDDNINKLKIYFGKIEEDLKNQNEINSNYKNSLDDINKNLLKLNELNNKIENTKHIIQNINNKNENKTKIENKKIEKYEKINDKLKLYKISQWNNKISFKDITNEYDENKTIEKIKITLKKDEEEKDKIVFEVENLYKDWDFKRHMVNIIKRINRARIVHRVNLNQLKHIYIMKFSDKQIHFVKKEAINKIVQNNNFYVKTANGFIFVNNKRRKFKNNRRNKFSNKRFNNNKNYNKNNNNYKYSSNNKNNTNLIQAFANFINGNKRNNFNNKRNIRNKNYNNRFKNKFKKRRFNKNKRYNNNNNNKKNYNNYKRQNFQY